MRSIEVGNTHPGDGDVINLHNWRLKDEEDLLSLIQPFLPGTVVTATLDLGPLRRRSFVAERVQRCSLVGNRVSEMALRTELFPAD